MAVTALVEQVQAHLQEVNDDPSKALNGRLLESIDRQVTEAIQESERDALLNLLSKLLPTVQQDPTPVTNLIQILICSSHKYSFTRALGIKPPVDFLAGLTSTLPPINLTVLALLEKARYQTSDLWIVAGKPEVVGALVKLWLCSPDTAVAGRAHDVISALLLADEEAVSLDQRVADPGLLWRRIFRDKNIYGSIFSICSLSTAGQDGQPSKRDKTVAQARLLDMLLYIDSEQVRTSQIPDVERRFGINEGGLLHFAAIHMVDYRDDVLMHMTLIDFFAKYLKAEHATIRPNLGKSGSGIPLSSSFNLDFLQRSGLHLRTMAYYLAPDRQDPMDLTYLYGSSANYLAAYYSTYPQDALKRPRVVESTLFRLTKVLHNISAGRWAQGQAPKHDLNVLVSLPRITLIPRAEGSPLLLIPPKTASANTYNALAHIFHGSEAQPPVEFENSSARVLYFFYMERFPKFWTQIVSAAETVAIKDVALAAISLIGAIITAQWAPLPAGNYTNLPSEASLAQKCGVLSLPSSGIEAIMSEPAIAIVVPYLMKPAQTFSNLVGGGRGDVESAAYRVAVAKHDVLILLHQKLKEWVGTHNDAQDMVATVGRRVAQGPMGGTSEVGGRVGTMEL